MTYSLKTTGSPHRLGICLGQYLTRFSSTISWFVEINWERWQIVNFIYTQSARYYLICFQTLLCGLDLLLANTIDSESMFIDVYFVSAGVRRLVSEKRSAAAWQSRTPQHAVTAITGNHCYNAQTSPCASLTCTSSNWFSSFIVSNDLECQICFRNMKRISK